MQSLEEYTSKAKNIDFRTECWIDGRFVPSRSGETFSNINPATGKKLCDVAKGNSSDIDAAVKAARTACLLYTSPSPRDRQKSRMPSSA